jgi:hypothetical protein
VPIDYTGMDMVLLYPAHTLPIVILGLNSDYFKWSHHCFRLKWGIGPPERLYANLVGKSRPASLTWVAAQQEQVSSLFYFLFAFIFSMFLLFFFSFFAFSKFQKRSQNFFENLHFFQNLNNFGFERILNFNFFKNLK